MSNNNAPIAGFVNGFGNWMGNAFAGIGSAGGGFAAGLVRPVVKWMLIALAMILAAWVLSGAV